MSEDNDLRLIVKINEEVKSIVALARRIDRLALNAILLSRRAGRVALGFGVIADELRRFSKELTQCMQALMSLSYGSVGTVSSFERQKRLAHLVERTQVQLDGAGVSRKLTTRTLNVSALNAELHSTFVQLQQMLLTADESSRFGSVIARSLKIEATYGGGHSTLLSQVADEFSQLIDTIPTLLAHIQHYLKGK